MVTTDVLDDGCKIRFVRYPSVLWLTRDFCHTLKNIQPLMVNQRRDLPSSIY